MKATQARDFHNRMHCIHLGIPLTMSSSANMVGGHINMKYL